MRTVYVVGYPGSGKSTLVGNALTLLGALSAAQLDTPIPHLRYSGLSGRDLRIWELGRHRDSFSGTDALAMNIQPKAIAWVSGLNDGDPVDVLIGEGDRLANRAFLEACPNLLLVHLVVPVEVARHRATQRAIRLGKALQNDAWWKGRVTKTLNLVEAMKPFAPAFPIDGLLPTVEAAETLAGMVAHGSKR